MTYISFKYRWTWEVSHCTNTDCLLYISLIKQWFWILRCLFGYFSFFLHISPWKKKGGHSIQQSGTVGPAFHNYSTGAYLSPSLLVSHARIQISTVHRNTSLKTLSLYNILLCEFCRAPCGRCRDQDPAAEQPQLPINFTGNWWPAKASPYSASLITQLTVKITGILKIFKKIIPCGKFDCVNYNQRWN